MKQVKPGSKRLSLNKQVITVLTQATMQSVKGGQIAFNSETKQNAITDCTGRPTTSMQMATILCCKEME